MFAKQAVDPAFAPKVDIIYCIHLLHWWMSKGYWDQCCIVIK